MIPYTRLARIAITALLLMVTAPLAANQDCDGGLPVIKGSFQSSCKNISYTCGDGVPELRAHCKIMAGVWLPSSLWYYADCAGDIRNRSGALTCERKGWQKAAEFAVDRPGQDYRSFHTAGDADVCVDACAKDPKCRAFTWTKAEWVKDKGQVLSTCWLKKAIPKAVGSKCCVSGQFPK